MDNIDYDKLDEILDKMTQFIECTLEELLSFVNEYKNFESMSELKAELDEEKKSYRKLQFNIDNKRRQKKKTRKLYKIYKRWAYY